MDNWESAEQWGIKENRSCNLETSNLMGYIIEQTRTQSKSGDYLWDKKLNGESIKKCYAKTRIEANKILIPDYIKSVDAVIELIPPYPLVINWGLRTIPVISPAKNIMESVRLSTNTPILYEASIRIWRWQNGENQTVWGTTAKNRLATAALLNAIWNLYTDESVTRALTDLLDRFGYVWNFLQNKKESVS